MVSIPDFSEAIRSNAVCFVVYRYRRNFQLPSVELIDNIGQVLTEKEDYDLLRPTFTGIEFIRTHLHTFWKPGVVSKLRPELLTHRLVIQACKHDQVPEYENNNNKQQGTQQPPQHSTHRRRPGILRPRSCTLILVETGGAFPSSAQEQRRSA